MPLNPAWLTEGRTGVSGFGLDLPVLVYRHDFGTLLNQSIVGVIYAVYINSDIILANTYKQFTWLPQHLQVHV
jgi:hypothetical protein